MKTSTPSLLSAGGRGTVTVFLGLFLLTTVHFRATAFNDTFTDLTSLLVVVSSWWAGDLCFASNACMRVDM